MSNFRLTIQKFAQVLRATSKDEMQENRLLVRDVCKQLNESLITPPLSLVQFLESDKTKKKIEKYTKRSAEKAVLRDVELQGLDPRLLDIEWAETHRDDQTRFRKVLGERSLGLQYHEWEIKTFQRSKLKDLREGSENYNTGEGNIAKFIKAHGFPEKDYVERAIRTGTRLLVLDHHSGTESASALVSFAPTRFRDVAYPDLENLATSLKESSWIASLMETIEKWVQDCRMIYSGHSGQRKRDRSECHESVHTGREKRGRLAGDATTQISVHSEDARLTIPPPLADEHDSSSRRFTDASTYTRDTSLRPGDTTVINESRRPGIPAPLHGTPLPASVSMLNPVASTRRADIESTLHPRRCIDFANVHTGLEKRTRATIQTLESHASSQEVNEEFTEEAPTVTRRRLGNSGTAEGARSDPIESTVSHTGRILSNDGGSVAEVPLHHARLINNVHVQHQHDQTDAQRLIDVVPTTSHIIAAHSGYYALPVDEHDVTTVAQQPRIHTHESREQTATENMMIQQPLMGESLEASNTWNSEVHNQPSWHADAAMAQTGHMEWDEWLLSLEPVDYSFEHQSDP